MAHVRAGRSQFISNYTLQHNSEGASEIYNVQVDHDDLHLDEDIGLPSPTNGD